MGRAGDPAKADAPARQRLVSVAAPVLNRENLVPAVAQQNRLAYDFDTYCGAGWDVFDTRHGDKIYVCHGFPLRNSRE